MSNPLPEFERLDVDFVTRDIIDDFVPLLGQLSSSFAKKGPDQQMLDVEVNLSNALEDPEHTAIFVYRDEDRIISTATANLSYTGDRVFGWVDDVVTLDTARGRRLGRGAMTALHQWLGDHDASHAYLTSAFERQAAGNLYQSMGYAEGGFIYRAPLAAPETDPSIDLLMGSSRVGIEVGNTDDDEIEGEVWVNDCQIPTGHKAWLNGLHVPSQDPAVFADLIDKGHEVLAANGATSANIMLGPDQIISTMPLYGILTVMGQKGYELRDTRLYTLDLRQQAA